MPTVGRLDAAVYGVFLLTVLAYPAGLAGYPMAGLLALLLVELAAGRLRWSSTALDRPLILLLAAALASGLASQWPGESAGLAALFGLTVVVTVHAAVGIIRTDPDRIRSIVAAWIAGAVLAAVWGIARAGEWPERASTPALLATALGTTLATGAALALGAWTVARTRQARVILAAVLPVLVAALELTASRGAWIAAAAGAAVLVAVTPRARGALVVLVLASTVVATAAIGRDRETVMRRLASVPSVEANEDRWALWTAVPAIVRDHPVLGAGYGTFTRVWPRYRPKTFSEEKPTAHNVYLNFAAETGLVGLAAFLLFVAAGLAGLWRATATARGDATTDGLWAGALAAAVAVLVHQLFDATVMSWHMGFGLLALFAMGAGAAPPSGPVYGTTPARLKMSRNRRS
ncbi:MAG: O-antigen ligase family protein [Armatimonadota bacterium]|nr:O-antigen ligase family protein [Armatimonadota bacterium]MDR7422310.1 O-antigen ligase family protein [Armatimonadota bacterium]MDR7454356.1 O-antigen ligase family protein [Armatimonadota bacterium]MDR7455972.1 O-antigen ligase family protein [Armatimonadota bacterium]MDR7496157.1 O-antigen ligase family protein [Armatimonadota bacterium]